MSTRVGKLRHRVTIQKLVLTPDGQGGSNAAWEDYKTLWAQVTTVSASESFYSQQLQETRTHKILFRWNSDLIPKDAVPEIPEVPEVPPTPEVPEVPPTGVPGDPDYDPGSPAIPATPGTPAIPAVPAVPAREGLNTEMRIIWKDYIFQVQGIKYDELQRFWIEVSVQSGQGVGS